MEGNVRDREKFNEIILELKLIDILVRSRAFT